MVGQREMERLMKKKAKAWQHEQDTLEYFPDSPAAQRIRERRAEAKALNDSILSSGKRTGTRGIVVYAGPSDRDAQPYREQHHRAKQRRTQQR